jgi:hypothetical protein
LCLVAAQEHVSSMTPLFLNYLRISEGRIERLLRFAPLPSPPHEGEGAGGYFDG